MKCSRLTKYFGIVLLLMLIIVDTIAQNSDYVYLEGNKFKLNGQSFYPVVANYGVSIEKKNVGGTISYVAGPYGWTLGIGFDGTDYRMQSDFLSDAQKYDIMVDDFKSLINHGFNAVRIVGIAAEEERLREDNCEYSYHILNSDTLPIFRNNFGFHCGNRITGRWCHFEPFPTNQGPYTTIFSVITQVLNAVNSASSQTGKPLKVILLAGGTNIDQPHRRADFEAYLGALAYNFKNNPAIMAYDFNNEPGNYHQTGAIEDAIGQVTGYTNYSKQDICDMIASWNNAVHANSSKHLTTIGLFGATDVFQWDPGIMDVDFISFHIYPKKNYAIRNGSHYAGVVLDAKRQIKWIANTMTKPWIIGEIGLSSSKNDLCLPDQGTNTQQRSYAEATMNFTRDVGGIGYSWWMNKDADYEVRTNCSGTGGYFGLWTMGIPAFIPCENNWTCTYSQEKTLADEFLEFAPFAINPSGGTLTANEYYNPYSLLSLKSGNVRDQNNVAIENAVISLGTFDHGWFHTYSKSDGSYTLYYEGSIQYLRASALYSGSQEIGASNSNFSLQKSIPDNLTVSEAITANKNFDAKNTITVIGTTVTGNGTTGVNCEMAAGSWITIQPSFQAQKGCHFKAEVGNVHCSSLSNTVYGVEPFIQRFHEMEPGNNMNDLLTPLSELDKKIKEPEFFISPNPNQGDFYLSSTDNLNKRKDIQIMSSTGEIIFFTSCCDNNIRIDLSSVPDGIYFVGIYCEGIYLTKKLVISR